MSVLIRQALCATDLKKVPIDCLLMLTILKTRNFYMKFFLSAPSTLPTLSYIQNIVT